MDPKLFGAYAFALLFDVGMPIALAIFVRRRLQVPWRYFWYGALIFFLFQMITRVPAVQVLQVVLAEPLRRSEMLQWAWIFALALTAGIFEEVGRYLGYRYLLFRKMPSAVHCQMSKSSSGTSPHPDPLPKGEGEYESPLPLGEGKGEGKSTLPLGEARAGQGAGQRGEGSSTQDSPLAAWQRGIMFGLGHGGLESMLLVGGMVLISLVNALVVLRMDPAALAALPSAQAEQVRQAQAIFQKLDWWMPLLGAAERLFAVSVQVGFSILVLQVFVRDSIKWLYLAILGHFLVDLVSVSSTRWLGPVGTEGLVALFALGALYLVFRLRPKEPVAASHSH